jgi:cysteine desulfurase/selenocysteine lyase
MRPSPLVIVGSLAEGPLAPEPSRKGFVVNPSGERNMERMGLSSGAMASLWDELRSDFPALARYTFLNAASSSPTPRPVGEAVARYYREMADGADVHWEEWIERREEVRSKVARLIGAQPSEIAFVQNTSAGMNLIVDLLAGQGAVLSDELEFPSVTLPWIHRGIPVHFLPSVEGVVRLESFDAAHAPKAAIISVSHVQFSNGFRQDLRALGDLKAQRFLVVSGSQSVGAFPIDVTAWHVDALASAGHKWLGAGYGTGFVYINGALLRRFPPRSIGWLSVEHPFAFDNRHYQVLDDNRRTEAGCPAFGSIFALGAAIDYLLAVGIEAAAERILALNLYLTTRLEREGFTVLSPAGDHRSGQTLCELEDPGRSVAFLRDRDILVTKKPEGIRISTHYYNNEEDVDRLIKALRELPARS